MRTFDESDFAEIEGWQKKRGSEIICRDLYPHIGLIAPGVAVGFLNFTDTKMAMIENISSNPDAKKSHREKAIVNILECLQKMAYDRGVRWIIAVTNHPKIEKYATEVGGVILPYKVFAKEL